jgi:hypothetical protein
VLSKRDHPRQQSSQVNAVRIKGRLPEGEEDQETYRDGDTETEGGGDKRARYICTGNRESGGGILFQQPMKRGAEFS